MLKRLPWWAWALLILAAVLIVCALTGTLAHVFAWFGSLLVGGVLVGQAVIDSTGKGLGMTPEPEVPGHPRRGPAGPISPPQAPDKPEEEPMHPSRRGSD